VCSSETLHDGFFIRSTSTQPANYKIEHTIQDVVTGAVVRPAYLNSKSDAHSLAGTYNFTEPYFFPFDGDATSTVKVRVCSIPSISFAEFAPEQNCLNMYLGNGVASSTLEQSLIDIGALADNEAQWDKSYAWQVNNCDDLGITDVFPAIKCGFIWAFYPSNTTVATFNTNLGLVTRLYPIGYATLIYEDFASSTSATSTVYFDRNINFGRWFGVSGGATTTIDADALLVHSDIASPILSWLELLLWIGFAGWLLVWGITRKL